MHADHKHYWYLFGIVTAAVLFHSLIMFNNDFSYPGSTVLAKIAERTPISLLCQFPIFCIAGYYFYSYRPKLKLRLIIYALGIIGVLISFIWNLLMFHYNGVLETSAMHDKFSIGNYLKTFAIFVLVITAFSDVKLSEKFKKFISKLSAATLFIYLFHWLMMMFLFNQGFLLGSGINGVILCLIYITMIYFTGFVISFFFLQSIPWVDMRNTVLDVFWPNRTLYVTRKKEKK